MKKIFAVALGIMLVAAACNKSNQAATPNANPPAANEKPNPASTVFINITADGFSPDHVVVYKGTKVVFANNDTQQHWVASDPHPTHTDLAGFDAKPGIAPGKTYSFVFNQLGKWGFHDHLFPSNRGYVQVVAK